MQPELINRFTNHLRDTIANSIIDARNRQINVIPPIFLLAGLARQKGSIGGDLLNRSHVSDELILPHLEEEQEDAITSVEGKPPFPVFSRETARVIERAAVVAMEMKHHYIGTEHLLYALLLEKDDHIESVLEIALTGDDSGEQKDKNKEEMKNKVQAMQEELQQILQSTAKLHTLQGAFSGEGGDTGLADTGNVPRASSVSERLQEAIVLDEQSTTPALDFFGTDLTAPEMADTIDPVIGRDTEIQRLISILSRRTKNNPLLIGEPGVGKTALVEGLAKRIVAGDVPDMLLDTRLISLDLSLMVAGSMYRGEFESRIKQVVEEVQQHPEIILFIDEIHTIVGAGGIAGSNMDAANMLKPALARGQINCIGATTPDEYRRTIEKDGALARRFQTIDVAEPSQEEAVAIITGLRDYYEEYHGVTFDDAAIHGAVELAERYIPEQQLPDKAIDLIDEAGAQSRSQRTVPVAVRRLSKAEKELHRVLAQKRAAVQQEQFDAAMRYKEQEDRIRRHIGGFKKKVKALRTKPAAISRDAIAAIVAEKTGVPLEFMTASSAARHAELQSSMKERVIGQDHVIEAITNVMKRAAAGISAPDRPLGSFLFLGPSGVGKTEMAKVLAEHYFGDREAIVRMDMSEFSEGFTVSKMLGSPAGYVGYEEQVKLSDQIRRRPYSVVLFDELEKAHPDMFNVLLQLLDEGRLTDSSGRELNFRNTIIVMTSNIGIDMLTKQAALGFETDANERANTDNTMSQEEIQSTVMGEVEQYLPTEFTNRIDHMLVFNTLTEPVMEQIVDRAFDTVRERAAGKDITLKLYAPARAWLARKSYNAKQGARNVQRVLTEYIETPLADMLLANTIRPGATVRITAKNDAIVLEKVKKSTAKKSQKKSEKQSQNKRLSKKK